MTPRSKVRPVATCRECGRTGVDLVRDGDAWRTLQHKDRRHHRGHCDGARYTAAEVCALATAQAAELRAKADGAAAYRAELRAQAEAACAQSKAREARQRADAAALDALARATEGG